MAAGYKVAVSAICVFFAIILDLCFMFCLHYIALWIASSKQSEEHKYQWFYQLLKYPDRDEPAQRYELKNIPPSLRTEAGSTNTLNSAPNEQNIDNVEEKKEDSDRLAGQRLVVGGADEFVVSRNRWTPFVQCSWCQNILAIWNILCGLFFIVLLIAMMINVAFEFLVSCYLHSKITLVFGILLCIFISAVMHQILNHSFSAVLLFWWNTVNVAKGKWIQFWWGILHFIIWVIYVLVFTIKSSKKFDRIFWKKLLEWMIIRGMVWTVLFVAIAFCFNIFIICKTFREIKRTKKNMSTNLFDYKRRKRLSYLNWQYFLFDIIPNETGVSGPNRTETIESINRESVIKYILCPLFIILIIFLFIFSYISRSFLFAAISLIMFYFIVWILDKIDFDAVYCIWSGKYHQKIWNNLTEYHKEKPVTEVRFLDLWSLFVTQTKSDYWCGFRCVFAMENNCQKCSKVDKYSLLSTCCISSFWIILSIAPFIYYVSKIRGDFANEYDGKVYVINWNVVNDSIPYPICETLDISGLRTLDLVYLTQAIYYPENVSKQLSVWFGTNQTASSWEVNYTFHPKTDEHGSTFSHIKNEDMDLILVRGTTTPRDAIEDLSLWSEIGVIQIISKLLPITSLTSIDFLRQYIYIASFAEGIIEPELKMNYYDSIYQYIKQNVSASINDHDKTIVILGHSLGGGVAQIAAAKLLTQDNANNVYSFSLASPGTLYSSKKFGFSVNSLYESSISVLPERDLVSQIDSHGGEIQHIKCDGKHAGDCHKAITHFCSMVQNCGKISVMENSEKKRFVNCVCGYTNAENTHNANEWDDCWGD